MNTAFVVEENKVCNLKKKDFEITTFLIEIYTLLEMRYRKLYILNKMRDLNKVMIV